MSYAHTYTDREPDGTLLGLGWTCEAGCGAGAYWKAPDSFRPEYVGCMNDAPLLKHMIAARDHLCRPAFGARPEAIPAGEQLTMFEVGAL